MWAQVGREVRRHDRIESPGDVVKAFSDEQFRIEGHERRRVRGDFAETVNRPASSFAYVRNRTL